MPTCARCGRTEKLEQHHLVPCCNGGGDGETKVLCHDCHVRLHAEAGHYGAWGLNGAQAVLSQYGDEGRAFLREIGARGGREVLARYGPGYLQEIARRGGRATAGKDGHLQRIAPLGGQAVARDRGRAYMRELGRKGAQARWQER